MHTMHSAIGLTAGLAALALCAAAAGKPPPPKQKQQVSTDKKHDTSPPLREISPKKLPPGRRIIPNHKRPHAVDCASKQNKDEETGGKPRKDSSSPKQKPQVSTETNHDTSPPLRDIPPKKLPPGNRLIPNHVRPRDRNCPDPQSKGETGKG